MCRTGGLTMNKHKWIVIGAATVVVLAISAGAVMAQTPPTPAAGTSFLDRVAQKLGIETPKLQDAIKGARTDQIDQAVQNGDLTQKQADALKSKLDKLSAGALGSSGLGRGFSDYDEIKAGLDLAVLPRSPLRLYAAHRRQGEGDYNVPFPDPTQYATTPGIFSGIVMGVTRVGVSGASKWRDVELGGDIGLNHVTNDGHITGATRTAFEGRVKFAIEPRWSVNF